MKKSPYLGLNENDWKKKTEEIVQDHPIKIDELVEIIKSSWDSIFASTIGTQKLQLGKDIVLSPQFTGSILGTLISHEFSTRYPKAWRPEASKQDKDLVYIPDEELSCEIKTSSSASRIYGNRSYAQPQSGNARKSKDGFYIGVNFDKMIEGEVDKKIRRIWFGWLDHTDWKAQASPTGQNASLPANIYGTKLLEVFRA
ncbi:restriction endonuclease [bacterium]|nr:MAG: restriction endonuclease [bacterium]